MKVALYARVSTKDGEQTPENQLLLLRQYAHQRGWELVREYVDLASATDLRGRDQWRDLLDQVRKGGVDLVAVVTQPVDTTTSTGKLIIGVLAAVAEFERSLIIERTLEGLARAKAQGKRLGRPPGSKDKRKRGRRGYLLRYAK